MPRHQLRERRMKTYNLETMHLVFRGHWLERGRELVAAQDVSIRRCVYLFVSEIVGSNSAPATKNFVARKLNGFRAFLLWTLVRAARHSRHRKPPAQRAEVN